ncbi:fibronectin type III domain-containing protein [Solicola sp. PLA-1-18]|uniref:fibronectin type III domain-containing protein n=1 Tax=Solicola sp. PLA-1-18 TaxID=3380532 RepID=UPI003B8073EE
MPPSNGRRRAASVVLGLALATGLSGLSAPASAAPTPRKPAGVRVVSVGDQGFTVTFRKSRYATKYRIWTSTTKSRLALSTISRTHASRKARKPRLTITGLPYTSAPYYFRVQAIGRGKSRYSGVMSTSLRTSTPTALRATSSATGGLALTWGGRAAARYEVQQATDGRMSRGVRSWSTRSVSQSFSPYGLTPGTTYWFRVRAVNGSSTSSWTAPVAQVARSRGLSVRVMTYNVLRRASDGKAYAGGERVASWSSRGPAVVSTIQASGADVVGLQEAADWTDRAVGADGPGQRQADWIRARLGSGWALATTETAPSQGVAWRRTGRYVVFDSGRFAQDAAGSWTLSGAGTSNPTIAAWAVLRERSTGARMLAVSAHLAAAPGAANDRRRQAETQNLLRVVAQARQAHGGVQVVYLGDFNSDAGKKHPLDGPGVTFRAARVADADEAAQAVGAENRYNSANQLLRTAPASATHVDHVFAPAGVGVRTWGMRLSLRGGRFVGVIPSDHNAVVADVVVPW